MAKKGVLILLLILVTVGYYCWNRLTFMKKGMGVLDRASYTLSGQTDFYKKQTGEYPRNIESFSETIAAYKDWKGYIDEKYKLTDDSLINPEWKEYKRLFDSQPWNNPFFDNFASDSLIRFMPILINGEYKYHVWYSVGMDNEDDTKHIIEEFNQGKTDKIKLEVYGPWSETINLLDIFNGSDVLINYPELNWDSSYFEIRYINQSS